MLTTPGLSPGDFHQHNGDGHYKEERMHGDIGYQNNHQSNSTASGNGPGPDGIPSSLGSGQCNDDHNPWRSYIQPGVSDSLGPTLCMALISDRGDTSIVTPVILGVGWQVRAATQLLKHHRQLGGLPPAVGMVVGSYLANGPCLPMNAKDGLDTSEHSLKKNELMDEGMPIYPTTDSTMFNRQA